jgi:hypothetical protein
LVVKKLDIQMVADERSMGEEALVKARRVTGGEFKTLRWVSINSRVLELDQVKPFASSLDLAKWN